MQKTDDQHVTETRVAEHSIYSAELVYMRSHKVAKVVGKYTTFMSAMLHSIPLIELRYPTLGTEYIPANCILNML